MSSVKGEYKHLGSTLIYRLQSIDIELLKIKQELREITINPNFGPEFMDRYILLRREFYADMGLKVAELSEDIREKLKTDADHGWSPKDNLLRSKAHIARIKSRTEINKMLKRAARVMRAKQYPFLFLSWFYKAIHYIQKVRYVMPASHYGVNVKKS
ncbi:hypothetical protein ACV8T3_02335 [Citrobacter portucalensis]